MDMLVGLTIGSWIGVVLGYYITGNADFSLPLALGITFCAGYAYIVQ